MKSGALVDKNALKAQAGDNIRIYFGNKEPNGVASFHGIGEIFDSVKSRVVLKSPSIKIFK